MMVCRSYALGFAVITNGILAAGSFPMRADAQSELHGYVLADSTRMPVSSAQLHLLPLGAVAVTDTSGRFRFRQVPPGDWRLITTAAGFHVDTTHVAIDSNQVVDIIIKLRAHVTVLASQSVIGRAEPLKGKLAGFYERRSLGIGRFLDRAELERFPNSRLAGVLSRVPGVDVRLGRGAKSWAVSSRATGPGKCAMCREDAAALLDDADRAAGAGVACYMDVYLDGILVYDSASRKTPLFDLNRVDLGEIEAIEVYTSAAQIPARFNRTSGGCGVIVLWTPA